MACYRRPFPEVCEDLLGFIRQADGSIQDTAGHGKIRLQRWLRDPQHLRRQVDSGVGVGVGLLKRKAKVLISNEAKPNDSNDADSTGTHRRLFLVDSDIAAGKSAAGGITVAQRDRYGVQYSWLSVISHTHIERNSGAVVQTSLTAELGVNACNGETLSFAFCYADTSSGVAKGIITERAAVVRLVRMKVEGDFVLLGVEGAARPSTLVATTIPGS